MLDLARTATVRRRFGVALTQQSLWMAPIAVLSKSPESVPCFFSLLSSIQFPDEAASLPPSSCLVGRHRLVLTLPLSYLVLPLAYWFSYPTLLLSIKLLALLLS
jgi:hypothetical protein